MFERYTEAARRALFFARYEASLLGSIAIGPEHLLLGLLREGQNLTDLIPAAAADAIREQVLRNTSERPPVRTDLEIPFASLTKRVLETAASEADALSHSHIGPEHLLLALATTTGHGMDVLLHANGIAVDALRAQIRTSAPTGGRIPLYSGRAAAVTSAGRRAEAARQIDAAVTFIQSIGQQHATVAGVEPLIERICEQMQELRDRISGTPG